ncbi:hypothetical protein [Streptomyces sp. VRA16 Mangrove soil]|uniref:hypothetical protein n=1 Tax=Streptomyces sp. VRA16 Mangrove soil TaxID=2817434 RepID=UPI001E5C5E78|nr:hypothetical protein [Streptomyces sp. VRA16 Mangrove soil]
MIEQRRDNFSVHAVRIKATGVEYECLLMTMARSGFGSHSFQVPPKLGVSGRAQLRDVLGNTAMTQGRTPDMPRSPSVC